MVDFLRSENLNFEHLNFKDHYDFTEEDISTLEKKELIVTTEKDFMKIPQEFKKEINYLTIDLIIQDERKLIELLTK